MTRIPLDPDGYSVNQATGTVHTRYAGEHAGTTRRTRTGIGVETLLDGQKGKLCRQCYPVAEKQAPLSAPQTRRIDRAEDGE